MRLWDRVFDSYVMTNMNHLTSQLLLPEAERSGRAREAALAGLAMAYKMIDEKLAARMWAAGATFSMADCAAAPSLFYSNVYAPIPADHTTLAAYFERLMSRPSVRRVIAEARHKVAASL